MWKTFIIYHLTSCQVCGIIILALSMNNPLEYNFCLIYEKLALSLPKFIKKIDNKKTRLA